ncbi:L-type lectin-domain containing receptor kinase S.4-like [Rhododendron vialii]|uniref:L-type lectin-domain containing receptor kinase S.4-like n=1 Tax=Rhododendron vialii TaxID=182163 RepID=UPI00265EA098|nr:L-type lectin-domain containing receptor kinase S.4-like [Rhododendron vialii]
MGRCYAFSINSFSSFTSIMFIILVIINPIPIESGKSKKKMIPNGPVINVTKYLSFADFNPNENPRIHQDINLLGSAIFSTQKGCIQIPPDTPGTTDLRHLAGRAIHSSPIRLFDPLTSIPASFSTTFSFQFNTTNSTVVDGGSGLTFIIVPDEFTVGRPGPWLGMLNDVCDEEYKAIGIEFDTRKNLEFGDPNDNHVGINLASVVSSTTIDASEFGIFLRDGSVHRAWVNYDGPNRRMDVRLGPDTETYPQKPVFSGRVDLSPFLKEYMFVGFSASTGNFTQIHNILSWNFTSTSQAFLRIPSVETCETKIILEQKIAHRKTPTSFLIFLAVVVLVLVILLNLYLTSKRKRGNTNGSGVVIPEKKERPGPPNKPRRFTIAELQSATRSFNESQELGSDSRGTTYKGVISNGCQVAMKRFSTQFLDSPGLDKRRLGKEISGVSKLRHPNLVPVRGWCLDGREVIVVYDYVQNGSIDRWLFGVGVLPWTRRFKVVKDVADSLSYLHSKQLAHKNVKTSSVFLDVSFRAVLGDYGFVLDSAESRRFESAVSQTADVFDFGIFVLEVVAGRRRRGSGPGETDLLDLAWGMHESDGKDKLVDRRMGSVLNVEQAVRVLEIGLLCTLNENKGRPTAEEVVEFLGWERPVPELPPNRPVSLFPYGSTTGLCTGYSCGSFK